MSRLPRRRVRIPQSQPVVMVASWFDAEFTTRSNRAAFLRDLDPRSHVIVAAQAVATRTAANGSSRHFEAMQQFGRFWSEADIEPFPFTGYRFSLGLRQHTASCSCAIGGTRCASAASIFSRSRLMILPEMPS